MGLFSPHLKEAVRCISIGDLCSTAHLQCCQQSSASVTALLLPNLHEEVQSLRNCFEFSPSGGGILF